MEFRSQRAAAAEGRCGNAAIVLPAHPTCPSRNSMHLASGQPPVDLRACQGYEHQARE